MNRFVQIGLLLIALAWCSPAWATWICVQGGSGCTTNRAVTACTAAAATCAQTITTPTEHNLGVLFGSQGTASRTISSITAAICNSTWTRGPTATSGTNLSGELWYCLDLHASGTTASPTWSGNCSTNYCNTDFMEFHTDNAGGFRINTGTTPKASGTGSTSPGTIPAMTVSAINSVYAMGFSNSLSSTTACSVWTCLNGSGEFSRTSVGFDLNQTSYTAHTVTSGATLWATGQMAFEETPSAGLATMPAAVY